MDSKVVRLKSFFKRDPQNIHIIGQIIDELSQNTDISLLTEFYFSLESALKIQQSVTIKYFDALLFRAEYSLLIEQANILHSKVDYKPLLQYYIMLCYFLQQDYICCLKEYDNAEANEQSTILAARCKYFSLHYTDALNLLKNLPQQNGESLGLRSLIELDLGLAEEALLSATQSIKIIPNQIDALISLGTIALAKEDFISAKEIAFACLHKLPNDGRSLMNAGQCFMVDGELEEAIKYFEAATQQINHHIGLHHLLGWCFLMKNALDKAHQEFEFALSLDGNFADSHGACAVIEVLQGKTDTAKRFIKIGLKLNAQCETALFAQHLLGEFDNNTDQHTLMSSALSAHSEGLRDGYFNLFAKAATKYQNRRQ